MNDSMLPDDLQSLAAGYVLGDLSSEEMEQFQQLLVTHPEMPQMLASLQETLALLPYGLPQQQPDNQVRSRLITQAQSPMSSPETAVTSGSLSHHAPRINRPRSLRSRGPSVASIPWGTRVAAGLVIVLGGCSLWLTHRVLTVQARLATTERFVELALQADESDANSVLTLSPADALLTGRWSGLAELVGDHLTSLVRSQGTVDVAANHPSALQSQFAEASQLPTLADSQAQLLGGSRCQFGQAKGVRLTYELAKHTVSVYQIDAQGGAFPEFLQTDISLTYHNVNLIFWREENYLYALVAELPLTDLQTLAHSLEPI